jgi:hypothetical protein
VSEHGKIRRQGKGSPKTHYHFKIMDCNYDWLCELARKHGVSVSKIINAILLDRPEPNEYYIR